MKILLVHNFYRYRGGEDRYVKILEDALAENGHQLIHYFTDSRDIKRFSFIQKCRIPFHLIRSRTSEKKLQQLLDIEKPDLAVVHNLFPLLSLSLLKILKKNNIKVLKRLENYKFLCLNGLFLRNNFIACERCKHGNFLHGVIHRCYQRGFFNSLGIAVSESWHHLKKTVIRYSDMFLATSQFVKGKFVEAGFPADKIVVHPNFLDFAPLPCTTPPGNYAVYVGRLSKEKGLLTLLKAFLHLPQLPLKILGEGPLEKELNQFVSDHQMKNIFFQGFIDGEAKREIIKKALFLVFPSECYESFGYTIIEAYGCGVPVVASDIGGARELVTEGQTGYLFFPGNPTDLETQVSRLVQQHDHLLEMRENARQRAQDLYSRETGHRDLRKLLERITTDDQPKNIQP